MTVLKKREFLMLLGTDLSVRKISQYGKISKMELVTPSPQDTCWPRTLAESHVLCLPCQGGTVCGVLPGAGSLRCSAPTQLRVSLAVSLPPYLGAQLRRLLCCTAALTAFGPGTRRGRRTSSH